MNLEELKAEIENLGKEDWRELLMWTVGPERDRREAYPAIEAERLATAKAIWQANESLKPKFVLAEEEQPTPEKLTKTALVGVYPAYKDPENPWEIYPLGSIVSHKREVYRKDDLDNSKSNKAPDERGSGWNVVTEELLDRLKDEKARQEAEDAAPNEAEVEDTSGPLEPTVRLSDEDIRDFRHGTNYKENDYVRKYNVVYSVLEDHQADREKLPADNPDLYKRLYEEEPEPSPTEAGQEAEETVQAPYAE